MSEQLPLNGLTITQSAAAFAQRAVEPLVNEMVKQFVNDGPKIAGLLRDPGDLARIARTVEQHTQPLINAYLGGALAAVSWLVNGVPDSPGRMTIAEFQQRFDSLVAAQGSEGEQDAAESEHHE